MTLRITVKDVHEMETSVLAMSDANKLQVSELWLSGCTQGVVPDLRAFVNLRKVDLSHNALRSLPRWFGVSFTLKSLQLGHNQLTHLPTAVRQCVHLKCLRVQHNQQLRRLPSWISELRLLEVLDAAQCSLRRLPRALLTLRSIQYLDLSGNPALREDSHLAATRPASLALLESLTQHHKLGQGWQPTVEAHAFATEEDHRTMHAFMLVAKRAGILRDLALIILRYVVQD